MLNFLIKVSSKCFFRHFFTSKICLLAQIQTCGQTIRMSNVSEEFISYVELCERKLFEFEFFLERFGKCCSIHSHPSSLLHYKSSFNNGKIAFPDIRFRSFWTYFGLLLSFAITFQIFVLCCESTRQFVYGIHTLSFLRFGPIFKKCKVTFAAKVA